MPYVSVKYPDGNCEDFELKKDKELTVGRGGTNTVFISGDGKISTRHCKIFFNEDRNGYILSDLNSTNGTFLNMQKMGFDALLADNDKIKVGDAIILYRAVEVSMEQTTTTKKVVKPALKHEGSLGTEIDIGASLHRKPKQVFINDFTLSTGERLGSYQIHSKISNFQFGSSYLAFKADAANEPVSLAISNAVFDVHHPAIDEFNNALMSLTKLENPYFVKTLDGGVHLGHCFYVTEHVTSDSLDDKLSQHGPFQELDALSIVYTVASALESAYSSCGMLHGRLSPSCILLDEEDNLMIRWHGLAKWMHKHLAEGKPSISAPAYTSPEQALNAQFDWQTDLYALGIILFQLIAGDVPFNADSAEKTLAMQINSPLPSLISINPAVSVSPEIVKLIVNMTAKAPEDRFSSWQELLAAMEEISAQKAG